MNKQNLMQHEWDKLMSKLDKMQDVVQAARSHDCTIEYPPAQRCSICVTLEIFDKAMEK